MANIGNVTVEIKPTVTIESACACVMMLNLFLDDNEDYRLALVNDGDGVKWTITDKSPMREERSVYIEDKRYERPRYQKPIEQMNDVEIALLNAEKARYRKLAGLEDE